MPHVNSSARLLPLAFNYGRWAQWGIVVLAGMLAWTLMMLAAVWQGTFVALFFPAGWCLYVALRQYRVLRRGSSPKA